MQRLIKPSFEVPSLDALILDTDGKPLATRTSHGLQVMNQETLWEIALRSGVAIPESGPIFDAGCGDFSLGVIAPQMVFPVTGARPVIAVDLDPKKTKTARHVANSVMKQQESLGKPVNYVVMEPQDLVQLETRWIVREPSDWELIRQKTVKKPPVLPRAAMVWCNSMFHWIRSPEDKYRTLEKFNRLLQLNGVLCISMSAGGTARDFLTAYHNVVRSKGIFDSVHNPKGFHRASLADDPIGSRSLDEITNMIQDSGFEIKAGVTVMESIRYPDPTEYPRAVWIYGQEDVEGKETFLRPFSHYSKQAKIVLWREIVDEFLAVLSKKGWEKGNPLDYPQFNNYVVAVKVSQAIEEEKPKPKIEAASVLHQQFLSLGFASIMRNAKVDIRILLEGDPSSLVDVKVTPDVREIFRGVISYAANNWAGANAGDALVVHYRREGEGYEKRLVIGFDTKTGFKSAEAILKRVVLDRLREEHIGIESKVVGEVTRHEFYLPLT